MPVPVTDDQLQQLRGLVDTLVTDKATADAATAASNAAHAALQAAQTDVALKDSAEASADGTVNVDVAALRAFIDNLAGPEPTPVPGS